MITFEAQCARLAEVVGIEEASTLLDWLQAHPEGQLDLSDCTHIHAANLQVLMVKRPTIAALPNHDGLRSWISAALPPQVAA